MNPSRHLAPTFQSPLQSVCSPLDSEPLKNETQESRHWAPSCKSLCNLLPLGGNHFRLPRRDPRFPIALLVLQKRSIVGLCKSLLHSLAGHQIPFEAGSKSIFSRCLMNGMMMMSFCDNYFMWWMEDGDGGISERDSESSVLVLANYPRHYSRAALTKMNEFAAPGFLTPYPFTPVLRAPKVDLETKQKAAE